MITAAIDPGIAGNLCHKVIHPPTPKRMRGITTAFGDRLRHR
jgi:hypothetical protein